MQGILLMWKKMVKLYTIGTHMNEHINYGPFKHSVNLIPTSYFGDTGQIIIKNA